ncbi:UDP-N-acetylglucosamine--LPS N-acetylglucosamine transferase [Paenibacillus sp. CCS19]|uniref:PssD/Cps14F family polysaccharide biosynthesis glycosyltransferase n=1 Tax=Paenibacillus sp. CCS19 TaxID=3158387 RepID=UPI0025687773|nr:PssD/Cps14F family polysaccharide biosynthesis glycosyltransferase [Paenibacillus cellulosilyticus]GMK38134.1 UDP-N-acetylglucosamine--LPS N-acetylglucosamine transferase [Paenibacillus cellulosilyticus]
MKICFAASSGGHLEQIMMLYPMMTKYTSFILTEKTNYQPSLKDVNVYRVVQINRREFLFPFKAIILFFQTLRVFLKEKPDVIISTGALATLPICLLAKIKRKKLIFIESFAKISSPTITGKIVYKFADLFLVQWDEIKKHYPGAVNGGGIY